MAQKKAKAKTAPKKKPTAKPAPKAASKPSKLLKKVAKVVKSVVDTVKGAKKAPAPVAKPEVKAAVAAKAAAPAKAPPAEAKKGKAEAGKATKSAPTGSAPTMSSPGRRPDGWMGPLPDKPLPRATKAPVEGEHLNKREMEQVLTVGSRGAVGEGSLKGKLIVYQGFPYLEVIGRDKRELWFLLQGPDQEVLPAYADHRVSISGLIRRHHNYGGSVDVRKYSAKKPEVEVIEVAEPTEVNKLRLLSPGEIETISSPGMSVGLRGFATLRGRLEQSGEEFYLVVSNHGTRQQVGFTLGGKVVKGARKFVSEIVVATGVVEKQTAWGGRIECENCEARAPDFPPVARDSIEVVEVEASGAGKSVDVKLNHGLSVHLAEKKDHLWAIEPQTAKRVSLREGD